MSSRSAAFAALITLAIPLSAVAQEAPVAPAPAAASEPPAAPAAPAAPEVAAPQAAAPASPAALATPVGSVAPVGASASAVRVASVSASARPDAVGSFEVSLGVGLLNDTATSDDAMEDDGSVAPARTVAMTVGMFVHPRIAVGARAAAAWTDVFVDGYQRSRSARVATGFVGPSLQLFVTDSFFVGGAAGAAILVDDDPATSLETAFGLDLRLGVDVAIARGHTLQLAGEMLPSFHDGERITAYGLSLGWQRR